MGIEKLCKAGKALMYGGTGTSVCAYAFEPQLTGPVTYWFGLTATELAAFGSIAIALVGLVISTVTNIWFKRQQLKMMAQDVAARRGKFSELP
jgi:hypothetical protein